MSAAQHELHHIPPKAACQPPDMLIKEDIGRISQESALKVPSDLLFGVIGEYGVVERL